jgi:N utilization substance protein B
VGSRTSGREAALQMLYALDVTGASVAEVITGYWRELPGDPEGRDFADELVRQVVEHTEPIDAAIRAASRHWRLERMTRVDRNVLRLGAYELAHCPEVPRAVIIDEAVELAKRYGSEGSALFVNGVLDRIADDVGRLEPAGAGRR